MKRISILLTCLAFAFSCQTPKTPDPQVTEMHFAQSFVNLYVGDVFQAQVQHTPATLPCPTYTLQSSDTTVATIDSQGRIVATGAGTASIRSTTADGNLKASCSITVSHILATSIKFKEASLQLPFGADRPLAYEVQPANCTLLNWRSSDTTILKVNNQGIVTTIRSGTAYIIASSGSVSAQCQVTTVAATSIKFSFPERSIPIGEEERPSIKVQPATCTEVNWKSSDTTIAKVDQGGRLTALRLGSAYIIASSGLVADTCQVSTYVKATGLAMDVKELTVKKGEYFRLTVTFTPENATNTWVRMRSMDENIVETPMFPCECYAKEVGTTEVVAYMDNYVGEILKDFCTITVVAP